MTSPATGSAPSGPAPALAPLLQTLTRDPYPLYKMLRSSNPVFQLPVPNHSGAGVWLLTRHRDVYAVLRDARFSAERERADVVRENRHMIPAQLLGETGALRSMLLMDPPDHTRVRGLVNKAFTPRRVQALARRIQEIVDELLDAVDEVGEMDVIRDFAAPLPAVVIAELLGVPSADHPRFKAWSTELISVFDADQGPEVIVPRAQKALDRLLDYLGSIVAERRNEPADDLISAMIQAQEQRDALTDTELLATSNLLLIAGHETTTNLIGNGLLALLRNPSELERLRSDSELLTPAVEELLRFDSPVQATVRVVKEALEIAGQPLAPGALVICGIGAANRDPEVFPDPDRLDVGRADNPHLSFGLGVHFCLGAPLARLEAQLAFRALLQRHPTLRLRDDRVEFRSHPILRGLKSLPVSW